MWGSESCNCREQLVCLHQCCSIRKGNNHVQHWRKLIMSQRVRLNKLLVTSIGCCSWCWESHAFLLGFKLSPYCRLLSCCCLHVDCLTWVFSTISSYWYLLFAFLDFRLPSSVCCSKISLMCGGVSTGSSNLIRRHNLNFSRFWFRDCEANFPNGL